MACLAYTYEHDCEVCLYESADEHDCGVCPHGSTADEHSCEVCPHVGIGTARKAFRRCKNPSHKDFMTIAEFVEKDPAKMLGVNRDYLSKIWDVINRTVRISLFKTSKNRPDTYPDTVIPYPLREIRGNCLYVRHGTGFLLFSIPTRLVGVPARKLCPCFRCKTAKKQPANPQFSQYYLISTATHVVFDDFEAESSSVDFFYDSEDRKRVVTIYGVRVLHEETKRLETDKCQILCVTHDIEVSERLSGIADGSPPLVPSIFNHDVLISHPHGVSKRISLGYFTSAKRVVMNEKKSPVVLKEGLRIRLRGKPDGVRNIVKTLRFEPDDFNNTIEPDQDANRKTFILTRNVTVSFPLRISVEHDIENDKYNDYDITSMDGREHLWCKDRWWTFPRGMEMAADCGTSCSLPCGKDEDTVVMEVYIQGSLFETPFLSRRDEGETSPVFDVEKGYYNYYTYSMACCKGSSGGAIIPCSNQGVKTFPEVPTHFGSLGHNGSCSLVENNLGVEFSQFAANIIRSIKEYFPKVDETLLLKHCQGNIVPRVQLSTDLPGDIDVTEMEKIFSYFMLEEYKKFTDLPGDIDVTERETIFSSFMLEKCKKFFHSSGDNVQTPAGIISSLQKDTLDTLKEYKKFFHSSGDNAQTPGTLSSLQKDTLDTLEEYTKFFHSSGDNAQTPAGILSSLHKDTLATLKEYKKFFHSSGDNAQTPGTASSSQKDKLDTLEEYTKFFHSSGDNAQTPAGILSSLQKDTLATLKEYKKFFHSSGDNAQTPGTASSSQKDKLDTLKKKVIVISCSWIRNFVKAQLWNVWFPVNYFSLLGITIPQSVVETEEGGILSLIAKFFSVLMAEKMKRTWSYGEDNGSTTGLELHSIGDTLVAEMEKDFPYAIPEEFKTNWMELFFLSPPQKPKDWWSRIKETLFNISVFLYEKRDVLCALYMLHMTNRGWWTL